MPPSVGNALAERFKPAPDDSRKSPTSSSVGQHSRHPSLSGADSTTRFMEPTGGEIDIHEARALLRRSEPKRPRLDPGYVPSLSGINPHEQLAYQPPVDPPDILTPGAARLLSHGKGRRNGGEGESR